MERNELIAEYRASRDPRKVEAVKWQRPVGPASLRRIKETLRAILRPAVDQGLLTHNVAKLVELPPAVRPKPKLWTPQRTSPRRHGGGRTSATSATCLRNASDGWPLIGSVSAMTTSFPSSRDR